MLGKPTKILTRAVTGSRQKETFDLTGHRYAAFRIDRAYCVHSVSEDSKLGQLGADEAAGAAATVDADTHNHRLAIVGHGHLQAWHV